MITILALALVSPEITLRFRPPVGQVMRYRMNVSSEVTCKPGFEPWLPAMTQTMDLEYRVVSRQGDQTTLEKRITASQTTFPPGSPFTEPPQKKSREKERIVVDLAGRLVSRGAGMPISESPLGLGIASDSFQGIPLPSRPVKLMEPFRFDFYPKNLLRGRSALSNGKDVGVLSSRVSLVELGSDRGAKVAHMTVRTAASLHLMGKDGPESVIDSFTRGEVDTATGFARSVRIQQWMSGGPFENCRFEITIERR